MFSPVLKIDIGVITAWSGAIGNIPPGWSICDGNNGTPDLRDKFIISAGPSFSVDNEAGSKTHTHTAIGDGHSHDLLAGAPLVSGPDVGFSLAPTAATFTTDPGGNMPPYYSLAYIMYTG